jgi:mRNA-degrading endonuclease toxin of MazEF toxin-antitoxin module
MLLASIEPGAGEVWIVDFGTTAKQRPVVVLAFPQPQDARALVIVAPLTSQIRGLRGEVDIGKPKWLSKHSAVNVQGLAAIDQNSLERKLGRLPPAQLEAVKGALRDLLNL